MIYLFFGDNAKDKHKAYINFVKSIPKEVEKFFISKSDFNKESLENFYSGPGLFSKKMAIIFSNILEKEDLWDFVLDRLPQMGESENDFIFLEGKLAKPVIDVFKKARAEINVFILPAVKVEKFNSFILAQALERKDRLNLWIYFRQAMDQNVSLEELVGILFWKAKDLITKKNFNKFSEAELQNFALKISYLLPEARSKGNDAEVALEQFLLDAF